jgi:hypothetical protein
MAAAPDSRKQGGIELAEVETNREPSVRMQWGQVVEIDDAYLRASMGTKIWRSVLFQMVLFGA